LGRRKSRKAFPGGKRWGREEGVFLKHPREKRGDKGMKGKKKALKT